jgi:hypothetical protein
MAKSFTLTNATFSSLRHTTDYWEAGVAGRPLMIFLHGWARDRSGVARAGRGLRDRGLALRRARHAWLWRFICAGQPMSLYNAPIGVTNRGVVPA